MVSNGNMADYEELSCAFTNDQATEGSKSSKTESSDLSIRFASSRRKDTKDSGYDGYSSECEDEAQNLPDWCRQYMRGSGDSATRDSSNRGGSIDDITDGDEEENDEERGDCDADKCIAVESPNTECPVDARDVGYSKENKIDSVASLNEAKGMQNTKGKNQKTSFRIMKASGKSHQRHRRVTPVPLSNPLKLVLGANPDCLFVEEEDTEDIKIFNLEDEYVDQGSLQLNYSPRGSPRLMGRIFESNGRAELHRMDAFRDANEKPATLISRCLGTDCKASIDVEKRQQQGFLETDVASDNQRNTGITMQELPCLYMRSRSENDACTLTRDARKKNASRQMPTFEFDHTTRYSSRLSEEEAEAVLEANTTRYCQEGKETNMASKDVPRAELDPAALLPDWMREANADDACLEKQSEASMQKDIEYINVKEQDNASVKLRKDAPNAGKKSAVHIDPTEVSEDVIKIYTPKKSFEGKKPRRCRKLTPARATSPSLEKLADLQGQIFAFSLAEQDSD